MHSHHSHSLPRTAAAVALAVSVVFGGTALAEAAGAEPAPEPIEQLEPTETTEPTEPTEPVPTDQTALPETTVPPPRPLEPLEPAFEVEAEPQALPEGPSEEAVATENPPFWNETTAGLSVNGTYTPIVARLNNAGFDSIIWYAPGSGTDYLWLAHPEGWWDKYPLPTQVSGTYTPLVGNFDGDDFDDIFWYAPGAAADYLWTSDGGGGFDSLPKPVSGTYLPEVLDDRVGRDDILWAKPGGGVGYVWSFEGNGTNISNSIVSPAGSIPLVGHFSEGVCADVFWYAAGPGEDQLANLSCNGQVTGASSQTVNGHYNPVVGDFSYGGDDLDDILWQQHPGWSFLWESTGLHSWDSTPMAIPVDGTPLPVAKQWGLVHVWSPTAADQVAWKTNTGTYVGSPHNTELGDGYQPIVGVFAGTEPDILWYKPGPAPERLFTATP